jgi:hypothetical protein
MSLIIDVRPGIRCPNSTATRLSQAAQPLRPLPVRYLLQTYAPTVLRICGSENRQMKASI